ncbi:DNA repair and recombination protein RAD54 [Nannizzia gypsea CBS 118893]|uniref:DNA repair and recombination protein RAD54 n=1 Tax=Arthroderma gypseum (strain ATCC MYA-4604 / CBS 118893) TaxID=535722 RepID=E4V1W2_ARTGP|nr:DNA repair and recombination protein RAD54 [Nannizzia gypsea CBS 118893]EFR04027.1 DNA repair and recombination protein RAD54 [Nannizzia gypsea CBS 118893]
MTFKPFRPPLPRQSQPSTAAPQNDEPLRKRRKVVSGIEEDKEIVINSGEDEIYYNVLWRKPTAKKNKTWDGDGIIVVRGGYGYLQDISGKEMGKAILKLSSLEPGATLSIGGKDVEVDSVLSKKEYLSSRPSRIETSSLKRAGKNQITTPVVPLTTAPNARYTLSKPGAKISLNELKESKTLNVSAPHSAAMNNSFKNPLKESTVLMPRSNGQLPTPRHDPTLPGSVVMQRPNSVPLGKQIVDVVVDPIIGRHLREHQREGVKFLYECVMGLRPFNGEGAILADEMGLGKTLQTIALIWTLLKQNPIYGSQPVIKKALIVCPVTLINNWKKEFKKWLGSDRIGVFVADGSRNRLSDFTMGRSYSVMIIGYERLRSVQEQLTKGPGIDIVIADEGHRLKTVQNKSAQAIQSLNTSRRIILSGTPIQNELSEFFAMVDFVNPALLGTFKSFMREFDGPIVAARQPNAPKKVVEKGKARSEELAELTSPFILRRTADILSKHLPPKTEYILFCNPTSAQRNVYQHVLASPLFQSVLKNSESALQLITILKKVCNSPSLLKPKLEDNGKAEDTSMSAFISSLQPNIHRCLVAGSSGKIRVLDQLLYNLQSKTTEKVVLVSNYTSTLNLLANLLTSLDLPFLRLDGSTPASKRQALVDDFNRSPPSSCFAFLLSAKAGGTGLNLIGASRLVLFDVDWNPATDIQAMARIHRDGQKRHCHIYRLLLKGGIEEKIWQRQVTKLGLADSVMDQKGGIAHFSQEELKDLFRLDENSKCQTHELLGCECGGRGEIPKHIKEEDDPSARSGSVSSSGDEDDELEDSDGEFLDLPKLMKASELKISEAPRPSSKQQRAYEKAKKRFLMQYSHIDTALLSTGDEVDMNDATCDAKATIEASIGDEVLYSLLKEEGSGVGYLFKKNGFGNAPLLVD